MTHKSPRIESWLIGSLSQKKMIASLPDEKKNSVSTHQLIRVICRFFLFLVYINDLNQVLKFCKVHHFADDTNLIHFSKFVNRLNKYVNLDLKNLTYWLNANRISLNVKKTELEIFKHQRKKLDGLIKIKLSRKKALPF